MFIFLDESYNLQDRSLPQFISINGFRVVDVTKVWKRWKEYRLPFVGKARIHGTDRLFEPLRAKCFKLLANHPDVTLLSVMQEIKLIPPKGDMVYYDKDGKLLFDNVYADMLKALLKELSLHAYKEVHITVASRKHKHGVLGEQRFRNNILHFLQNWYPATQAHFTVQPMAANVLLEIADFVSNSLYRQYAGEDMPLLEPLKGKIIVMKNPLK